jgi:hypothetical protein
LNFQGKIDIIFLELLQLFNHLSHKYEHLKGGPPCPTILIIDGITFTKIIVVSNPTAVTIVQDSGGSKDTIHQKKNKGV